MLRNPSQVARLAAQERIRELVRQAKVIAEEIRTLGGDVVWDFNDVWGGAGPDCSPRPWYGLKLTMLI